MQIQRIGHTARYPQKCSPFFATWFHVRRLLKRTTASEQNYHTRNWDVCDTLPSRFDASIQAMNEQDFAGPRNTKERWIPNTGEYLLPWGQTPYRLINSRPKTFCSFSIVSRVGLVF